MPYPLPKLDMICITEFAAGAMENWGLVTYRETALMIDEAKASSQQKQRVAAVIAHELAHQWFGELLSFQSLSLRHLPPVSLSPLFFLTL